MEGKKNVFSGMWRIVWLLRVKVWKLRLKCKSRDLTLAKFQDKKLHFGGLVVEKEVFIFYFFGSMLRGFVNFRGILDVRVVKVLKLRENVKKKVN